jgi:dTDP-4-amino-4,6-dideoxygalactose transaminase
VLAALQSGWVAPIGPDLDAWEAEVAAHTGWAGVAAVSSGTAALHLALLVAGVGPDDDVLVSSFTFAASANAVTYTGARPVFVDSETTTWGMDPQLLSDALQAARRRGTLPRAVVTVDLYGQCADHDALVNQCRDLGVTVVEDAAEAVGSTYKGRPAGTLGDLGVYSFNGNKIITTSSGGMVLSPDPAVAARVRHLATQAREPAAHYQHTEIGYNYRLSNLLAALGRAQFERLPDLVRRRREIHAQYRQHLAGQPGVSFMPLPSWSGWNGWLTCLVLPSSQHRDRVLSHLAAAQIEARPLWKPMHLQPVFAGCDAVTNGTSERLFSRGLCLPSGSGLHDFQVQRISAIVAQALSS